MRQRPPPLPGLLKEVSRSFYLTLRVLPKPIRAQIGLAYLLARASDTIADTDAIPEDQRREVLGAFRDRVCRGEKRRLDLGQLAGHQSSAAEQRLLERLPEALHALETFDAGDQTAIRTVLEVIISGQTLDLQRFAHASAARIVALEVFEELDDYTYRVAGCVGDFWTRMCRTHLFATAPLDMDFLVAAGVRFGKGLQLVNVLRDLPADLRIGRCYLPRQSLAQVELQPSDLLDSGNEPRLRRVYDPLLDLAEQHLAAGWEYTDHLPRRPARLRLACAWPILIGIQTLAKLRMGPILDPARRIKISRAQVRTVITQTILWHPWPRKWHGLFQSLRRKPFA